MYHRAMTAFVRQHITEMYSSESDERDEHAQGEWVCLWKTKLNEGMHVRAGESVKKWNGVPVQNWEINQIHSDNLCREMRDNLFL